MKIEMEFQGLKELMKAFEDAASDEDIKEVNQKIVKQSEPVVKIKSLMKENDFSFDGRNGDDSKPEDGIYMKAQRFSKFYEMEE